MTARQYRLWEIAEGVIQGTVLGLAVFTVLHWLLVSL